MHCMHCFILLLKHSYGLSYQHIPNTKMFAEVVYMDLTFTSRSSVTFPPTTAEIELLAVLPTWQGSVASPGSLAPQLSPTGWKSGRVDGSAAWLLAASLPFLAQWKGRDGEPSLSVHWSRASPLLATIRAKGQLRPTDASCVHILWSDSFSHPGSESLSLLVCAALYYWWLQEDSVPLRIVTPSLMGWCILRAELSQMLNFPFFLCQPHYTLLLLLEILLSPAKLEEPSF